MGIYNKNTNEFNNKQSLLNYSSILPQKKKKKKEKIFYGVVSPASESVAFIESERERERVMGGVMSLSSANPYVGNHNVRFSNLTFI